jgi:AcrR family transcriptional regulator
MLRCNVTLYRKDVKVGRPIQHDARTRTLLLAVAESLLDKGGIDAISVRAVAQRAGTSTRAVYSLFGSKEGLLVALAEHGFNILGDLVRVIPLTADPIADLVAAGMHGFRAWTLQHPALYRLTFDRMMTGDSTDRRVGEAAGAALQHLRLRVVRASDAAALGGRDVEEVIIEFDALCEGIATIELRGMLAPDRAERLAHDAFEALLRGMAHPPVARGDRGEMS